MKRTFAFLILTLCVLAFMLISCDGEDVTSDYTDYTITYELNGGINNENNMPVGMQFIAKAFDEENLLQIAYAFEQNVNLKDTKPNI